MRRIVILFLMLTPSFAAADDPRVLSRIGFGSCVHQDKPQPIWDTIVGARPDLFLLLGDNIYADVPRETVMSEAYAKLAAQPGFRKLRAACPLMAIWDDHDYGLNDAGVEFMKKDDAKKQFLEFFGEPRDSPRWSRPGIYDAKIFGPPGKRVQVILLDCRYNRSELKKGRRGSDPNFPRVEPYVPNLDEGATMLGEEQWKWLAEQLRRPAEVRLVCSGIQVISEDHPFEKWMNIPRERQRLFDLIRDTRASGVILLSGDRHLADLSSMPADVGYTLYDLTASGLNQAAQQYRPIEPNRHRVAGMSWGDHFGWIEVDWALADPLIRLQIRDEDGQIAFQHRVPLGALAAKESKPERPIGEGAISTDDAKKKVGEKVTIEMTAAGSGSSGRRVFLNSHRNRNDPKNFTVVIEMDKAEAGFKEAKIADPRTHFAGKVIRVTGEVTKFREQEQIVVTEAAQIRVVE